MNQLVQLVNEWDKYETANTDADIANFCRYYLASVEAPMDKRVMGGQQPPTVNAQLLKLMGRMLSLFRIYQEAAMLKAGLPFTEAFYYLNLLRHMKEAKKTELINAIPAEYTTGMDSINKLIKLKLISERQHTDDKRAKLISLTPKGEKLLGQTYPYMAKATEMFLKDLSQDTIKLCISLLSPAEVGNAEIALQVRGMDFDEMHEAVMNTKPQ